MNNKIVWKHDEEKDYYELMFNNESVLRFAVNTDKGYFFWVSEMLNVEYECGDFHSIEETKEELEDICSYYSTFSGKKILDYEMYDKLKGREVYVITRNIYEEKIIKYVKQFK